MDHTMHQHSCRGVEFCFIWLVGLVLKLFIDFWLPEKAQQLILYRCKRARFFFHHCKHFSHTFRFRYEQSMIDLSHCAELEVAVLEQMEWNTGNVLKRNFWVLVVITLLVHPMEKSEGCT